MGPLGTGKPDGRPAGVDGSRGQRARPIRNVRAGRRSVLSCREPAGQMVVAAQGQCSFTYLVRASDCAARKPRPAWACTCRPRATSIAARQRSSSGPSPCAWRGREWGETCSLDRDACAHPRCASPLEPRAASPVEGDRPRFCLIYRSANNKDDGLRCTYEHGCTNHREASSRTTRKPS